MSICVSTPHRLDYYLLLCSCSYRFTLSHCSLSRIALSLSHCSLSLIALSLSLLSLSRIALSLSHCSLCPNVQRFVCTGDHFSQGLFLVTLVCVCVRACVRGLQSLAFALSGACDALQGSVQVEPEGERTDPGVCVCVCVCVFFCCLYIL